MMVSIFLVAMASSAISDCPQPEAFYAKLLTSECLDALVEEDYRTALSGGEATGVYSKELLALGGFPLKWKDPDGSRAKACEAKLMDGVKATAGALAPECKKAFGEGMQKALQGRIGQLSAGWLKEFSGYRSAGGYAETRWGMMPEEVKKRVNGLSGDSKRLLRKDKVAGLEAVTGFVFTQGRLTSVVVVVTEQHTASQRHVEDFLRLKELLVKKYGDPESEEDVVWNSEAHREMLGTDNLGAQVLLGQAKLESKWDAQTTGIVLQCTGDKLKVQNGVTYVSLELLPWAKAKMDDSDSSKL